MAEVILPNSPFWFAMAIVFMVQFLFWGYLYEISYKLSQIESGIINVQLLLGQSKISRNPYKRRQTKSVKDSGNSFTWQGAIKYFKCLIGDRNGGFLDHLHFYGRLR